MKFQQQKIFCSREFHFFYYPISFVTEIFLFGACFAIAIFILLSLCVVIRHIAIYCLYLLLTTDIIKSLKIHIPWFTFPSVSQLVISHKQYSSDQRDCIQLSYCYFIVLFFCRHLLLVALKSEIFGMVARESNVR